MVMYVDFKSLKEMQYRKEDTKIKYSVPFLYHNLAKILVLVFCEVCGFCALKKLQYFKNIPNSRNILWKQALLHHFV